MSTEQLTYSEWHAKLDAHLVAKCGFTRDELPESGPMPFDYPSTRVEHEVGTDPIEVADHILWCVGFPGAEPVL